MLVHTCKCLCTAAPVDVDVISQSKHDLLPCTISHCLALPSCDDWEEDYQSLRQDHALDSCRLLDCSLPDIG